MTEHYSTKSIELVDLSTEIVKQSRCLPMVNDRHVNLLILLGLREKMNEFVH